MSYPLPPGGLFPLTTAPTGRNAGGAFPLSAVLVDAIKSLAPTAYWKLDEVSGNLADAMSGGYTATVTGSPTYGVAAPSPIGRAVRFSAAQAADTATDFPIVTTGFSYVAMLRPTASGKCIIDRLSGGNGLYVDIVSPTYVVRMINLTSTTQRVFASSTATIGDGQWHFVAFTCTVAGATTFLVDDNAGQTVASAQSWTPVTGVPFHLFRDSNSAGAYSGDAAHVAYWNDRILSSAELRWLSSIARGA